MKADLRELSIDWQILQDLLQMADDLGVDIEALGREIGWGGALPQPGVVSVDSFEAYSRFDRHLVDAIRKAVYERVGLGSMSLRDYEILFHYMLGAGDLRGALRRIPHFAQLAEARLRNARMELQRDGAFATISLDWGAGTGQERYAGIFFNEFARLVYMLEWMIGRPIGLRQLVLPHGARSSRIGVIAKYGIPVEFAGDCYVLRFAAEALEAPIVRDLGELQELMKVYPAVTLLGRNAVRLAERIGQLLISQSLASKPMLQAPQMASAMNISETTMRRRLQEEGTSYGEIRRQCQMRLACHLLRQPGGSITAVGYQIGFNDETAFRRAFKSWTGESPAKWRATQRGAGDSPADADSEPRGGNP